MAEESPASPNPTPPTATGQTFVPPSPEELDAVLEGYEVVEMLGAGGMGAVYKARQPKLARFVAIKVLPPLPEDDVFNFAERFQREAQAMAQLSHPNIVHVYDFGETSDGKLYFVMEYIEGTDLHQLIRGGQLTPDHALGWIPQICSALQYAHAAGIVHRDIKPANIMITNGGEVKVADFGLAKLTGGDAPATNLTLTNVSMGTPEYVAPEVLEMGKTVDHRADIFALGVLLYEMLTGVTPKGHFKPPSEKTPGLDPRFDDVVLRAMAAEPEERFQQAGEITDSLLHIQTTPEPDPRAAGAAVKRPKLMTGPVLEKSAAAAGVGEMKPAAVKKSKAGPALGLGIGIGVVLLAVGVTIVILSGGGKPAPTSGNDIEPEVTETPAPAPPKAEPKPAPATPKPKPKSKPVEVVAVTPEPPSTPADEVDETEVPTSAVPAPSPLADSGEWVDLVPAIDPQKDVIGGKWEKAKNGGLVKRASTGPWAFLETPMTQDINPIHIRLTYSLSKRRPATLFIPHHDNGILVFFGAGLTKTLGDTDRQINYAPPKPNESHLLELTVVRTGSRIQLHTKVDDDHSYHWDSDHHRHENAIEFLTESGGLSSDRLQSISGIALGATSEAECTFHKIEAIGAGRLPSATPPPQSEVQRRLAEVRNQFRKRYQSEVHPAHEQRVAKLNESYISALKRAENAASNAANLDEVLIIRQEIARVEAGEPMPDASADDPKKIPAAVIKLRQTWRAAAIELEKQRTAETDTLAGEYDAALETLQREFTSAAKIDEALEVKAVRDKLKAGDRGWTAADQPPAS